MSAHRSMHVVSLLALFALTLFVSSCDVGAFAASQQISSRLQTAFNTLPDALQTGDLAEFEQYVATPQQGADPNGLAELYAWINQFKESGTLPQADAVYELRSLDISQINIQGALATAHVHIELSKIGAGNEADVAMTVDQDVALKHVNDAWLIVGADPAQVTNESQPVR